MIDNPEDVSTLNPSLSNLRISDDVDSLLVLLQRRKGIPELRKRWNDSIAFGVGLVPTCRFPETSIKNARISGRVRGFDIF